MTSPEWSIERAIGEMGFSLSQDTVDRVSAMMGGSQSMTALASILDDLGFHSPAVSEWLGGYNGPPKSEKASAPKDDVDLVAKINATQNRQELLNVLAAHARANAPEEEASPTPEEQEQMLTRISSASTRAELLELVNEAGLRTYR